MKPLKKLLTLGFLTKFLLIATHGAQPRIARQTPARFGQIKNDEFKNASPLNIAIQRMGPIGPPATRFPPRFTRDRQLIRDPLNILESSSGGFLPILNPLIAIPQVVNATPMTANEVAFRRDIELKLQALTKASEKTDESNDLDDGEAQCDRFITGDEFFIRSPNYPYNYPRNTTCSWQVYRRNSGLCGVKLTVLRFDLAHRNPKTGLCPDTFTVGQRQGMCGRLQRGDTLMVPFPGLLLEMTLNSGDGDGASGMLIKGEQVSDCRQSRVETRPITIDPQCIRTLHGDRFSLQSPGYPGPYPHNSECWYYIHRRNEEQCGIELSMDSFSLESASCMFDYLESNNTRICGKKELGTKYYLPFEEGKVRIRFRSDESITRPGFRISGKQVSCDVAKSNEDLYEEPKTLEDFLSTKIDRHEYVITANTPLSNDYAIENNSVDEDDDIDYILALAGRLPLPLENEDASRLEFARQLGNNPVNSSLALPTDLGVEDSSELTTTGIDDSAETSTTPTITTTEVLPQEFTTPNSDNNDIISSPSPVGVEVYPENGAATSTVTSVDLLSNYTKPILTLIGVDTGVLNPELGPCDQVYSGESFLLKSPRFPSGQTVDCSLYIRKAYPDVCEVAVHLMEVSLDPPRDDECQGQFLQVAGQMFCGGDDDTMLLIKFPGELLRMNLFAGKADANTGFAAEVKQIRGDECADESVYGSVETTDSTEDKDVLTTTTETVPPATTENVLPTSTESLPTSTENELTTSTENVLPTSTEFVLPTSTEFVLPTSTENELPTSTEIIEPEVTTYNSEEVDCDLQVTKELETITSPSFPSSYPHDLDCAITVTKYSAEVESLSIYIEDFEVEESDDCENDYFSVGDDKFCGVKNKFKKSYEFSDEVMTLKFHTNGDESGRGYKIHLKQNKAFNPSPSITTKRPGYATTSTPSKPGPGFLTPKPSSYYRKTKPTKYSGGRRPIYYRATTRRPVTFFTTPRPVVTFFRAPKNKPITFVKAPTKIPLPSIRTAHKLAPNNFVQLTPRPSSYLTYKKKTPRFQTTEIPAIRPSTFIPIDSFHAESSIHTLPLEPHDNTFVQARIPSGNDLPLSTDSSEEETSFKAGRECGWASKSKSITIKSPNYPKNPPTNLTCVYTIRKNSNSICQLRIEIGELKMVSKTATIIECGKNFIQIGTQQRLCGATWHDHMRTYIFTEDEMQITFKTGDEPIEGKFDMKVTQLPCGTVLPIGSFRGSGGSEVETATFQSTSELEETPLIPITFPGSSGSGFTQESDENVHINIYNQTTQVIGPTKPKDQHLVYYYYPGPKYGRNKNRTPGKGFNLFNAIQEKINKFKGLFRKGRQQNYEPAKPKIQKRIGKFHSKGSSAEVVIRPQRQRFVYSAQRPRVVYSAPRYRLVANPYYSPPTKAPLFKTYMYKPVSYTQPQPQVYTAPRPSITYSAPRPAAPRPSITTQAPEPSVYYGHYNRYAYSKAPSVVYLPVPQVQQEIPVPVTQSPVVVYSVRQPQPAPSVLIQNTPQTVLVEQRPTSFKNFGSFGFKKPFFRKGNGYHSIGRSLDVHDDVDDQLIGSQHLFNTDKCHNNIIKDEEFYIHSPDFTNEPNRKRFSCAYIIARSSPNKCSLILDVSNFKGKLNKPCRSCHSSVVNLVTSYSAAGELMLHFNESISGAASFSLHGHQIDCGQEAKLHNNVFPLVGTPETNLDYHEVPLPLTSDHHFENILLNENIPEIQLTNDLFFDNMAGAHFDHHDSEKLTNSENSESDNLPIADQILVSFRKSLHDDINDVKIHVNNRKQASNVDSHMKHEENAHDSIGSSQKIHQIVAPVHSPSEGAELNFKQNEGDFVQNNDQKADNLFLPQSSPPIDVHHEPELGIGDLDMQNWRHGVNLSPFQAVMVVNSLLKENQNVRNTSSRNAINTENTLREIDSPPKEVFGIDFHQNSFKPGSEFRGSFQEGNIHGHIPFPLESHRDDSNTEYFDLEPAESTNINQYVDEDEHSVITTNEQTKLSEPANNFWVPNDSFRSETPSNIDIFRTQIPSNNDHSEPHIFSTSAIFRPQILVGPGGKGFHSRNKIRTGAEGVRQLQNIKNKPIIRV